MRKLIWIGLIFASIALAQRGGGDMGMGDEGGGFGRGGRNGNLNLPNIGPPRMSRLETMAGILNLSKDQKKQVKSIMDEGQKEAAPLQEQLAKSRTQIAEAVASAKSQDEIGQAVKAYSELQAQMARIELEAFTRIYKLLDGDQKSKSSGVFQMMAGIFSGKNWNETS